MPEAPNDPIKNMQGPWVDDDQVMAAKSAASNEMRDATRNSMGKGTGALAKPVTFAITTAVEDDEPNLYAIITGGGGIDWTLGDVYKPGATDIANYRDRGGFRRRINNLSGGTAELTTPSGTTTIESPIVGSGAIAEWMFDAVLDRFIRIPTGGGTADIGWPTTKTLTGGNDIDGRAIWRKSIDMGAGPNATTKSIAHAVTSLHKFRFSYIQSSIVAGTSYTLSYVNSATTEESVLINGANIDWTTINDRTVFNGTAYLEWTET